jgi:ABC-type transport system involved in multi-copper enzyme maturation permease subunit
MKSFASLYVKELRENSGLALFAISIIVLAILYSWFSWDDTLSRRSRDFHTRVPLVLAAFSTIIVPVLLLIRAYASERRSGSRTQLYALPVSRPVIGLSKLAAALTYGIGMAIVTLILADALLTLKFAGHPLPEGFRSLAYRMILSFYLIYSFMLLSIVTFAESVGETNLPYKRVAIGGLAVISLFLYGRYFKAATDGLSFLGTIRLGGGDGGMNPFEIAWLAYPAGVGLLLLGIGSYVLHRHSDI